MSEPQSQAKAGQCRIFDATSIRKYSPAIRKDACMRIEAKLHSASYMISPLGQVLELPSATAEHVRGHGDLVDRQSDNQTAVDTIGPLPFFEIAIRAHPDIAREEVVEAQPSTEVVSRRGKAVSVGVRPEKIQGKF